MYRIHICDAGYKVLREVIRDYASNIVKEGEEPDEEDMAVMLGCMLLLDDLNQATHIEDKE